MAEPAAALPARLTLADQALINLAGALTCRVMAKPSEDAMLIDCIAEVLPQVQRQHLQMRALAEAAGAIVKVARKRGSGTEWAAAHLALSSEAAKALRWRAGLALDAWRTSLAEAAPAADMFPTPTGAPDGPSPHQPAS